MEIDFSARIEFQLIGEKPAGVRRQDPSGEIKGGLNAQLSCWTSDQKNQK